MTISAQMKRLEALEAATRMRQIDQMLDLDSPELQELAARIAEKDGISADELLREAAASHRRIAEIGEDAWIAEVAAQFGMTDEEWLTRDHDADWQEHKEWERTKYIGSEWWLGGVHYRDGVPVPGPTDSGTGR